MDAYVRAFYDPRAHYFYLDTRHTAYNRIWEEALSWDIVMDAYQRTHGATYRQLLDATYDGFMARNADLAAACTASTAANVGASSLADTYNDDIGWWANASIRAYQLTGERRYVTCAQRLFAAVYASWDTTQYGGGIWWTRDAPQEKNVATNAPAVITAVDLAAALRDRRYLDDATRIYAWLKRSLTTASGTVYDGYNQGMLRTWQLSYNYGVFIGAATALFSATGNATYRADALRAAQASLMAVAAGGVLQDEGSSGDGGGFKGIYARYLAQFAITCNQPRLLDFLRSNAVALWSHRRRSDDLVAGNWAAPTPSGPIEAQTAGSAVALLQVVPPTGA